jgi:hypothetical protein
VKLVSLTLSSAAELQNAWSFNSTSTHTIYFWEPRKILGVETGYQGNGEIYIRRSFMIKYFLGIPIKKDEIDGA